MAGKRRKDRVYDHGQTLKQLREMAGLTQPEAAKVTSISWQTLANVEQDKVGIKLCDLEKLLELYKNERKAEMERQRNSLTEDERRALYDSTLGLAYFFVNRYYNPTDSWCDKQDLEQVACMALWTATLYYDPDHECKFGTYASRLIKGELVDFLYTERQAQKGVNVSSATLQRANKVRKMMDSGLTEEKIAAEMGIGLKRVMKLYELSKMKDHEPLTTSDDDGDEYEAGNVPSACDTYEELYAEERGAAVADALASLPSKQRDVVERVHGLNGRTPRGFKAIAEDLGKGYGTVSGLYHLGMARLRHPRNSQKLAGVM